MKVGAVSGLRARKNLRTQQAIVRAAAELTLEGGYAHATIPRIAERADVSPRTVSVWFPVKDDILVGDVTDQSGRARRHLLEGEGNLVARLAAWFAEEREHPLPDPELSRLRFEAIERDAVLRARDRAGYETIAAAVATVVAADLGVGEDDVGPQVVAGAVTGLLQTLRARSFSSTREEIEPVVADGLQTVDRILAALR